MVRPVISHNVAWGTSLAWGVKGYETILRLMLFNMAGSCLSGRLPACLSVCLCLILHLFLNLVLHTWSAACLWKLYPAWCDCFLVSGLPVMPDSLYEPSPWTNRPSCFTSHFVCVLGTFYSFLIVCECAPGHVLWFCKKKVLEKCFCVVSRHLRFISVRYPLRIKCCLHGAHGCTLIQMSLDVGQLISSGCR